MAEIQDSQITEIIEACQAQVETISGCLNSCLISNFQLEAGEQSTLSSDSIPAGLDGPGMAVVLSIGEQHLVCLIPESLPIPDWYLKPDETESSRLQTLGMEWSMCMLPETIMCSSFKTVTLDNLRSFLEGSECSEGAFSLKLNLKQEAEQETETEKSTEETPEDAEEKSESESVSEEVSEEISEGSNGSDANEVENSDICMWVVGPLNTIPEEENDSDSPEVLEEAVSEEAEAGFSAIEEETPEPHTSIAKKDGVNRFRKMPVTISVRLAEKRMELGDFLAITPGTLITFDKSCESPLELYVNNYRYCSGEAVKIGEHFGLKIDDVGVVDVREERIL